MTIPDNGARPLPANVVWFEALMYLSLALDAVSIAFQDRTTDADMTDATILAANVAAACLLLLFVWMVGLAARRRKNWPRWVLSASLVFSVLSLVQIIGTVGLQFDSVVEIVSCALTAVGLYFSYTGDARGWFNG